MVWLASNSGTKNFNTGSASTISNARSLSITFSSTCSKTFFGIASTTFTFNSFFPVLFETLRATVVLKETVPFSSVIFSTVNFRITVVLESAFVAASIAFSLAPTFSRSSFISVALGFFTIVFSNIFSIFLAPSGVSSGLGVSLGVSVGVGVGEVPVVVVLVVVVVVEGVLVGVGVGVVGHEPQSELQFEHVSPLEQ